MPKSLKSHFTAAWSAVAKPAAVAVGLGMAGSVVAGTSAQALPVFTLNPALAVPALNGTAFSADNIVVSDYSTVMLTPTSATTATFTDNGFLSVQSFQLGGATVITPGLNTTYGLYFQFAADGTTSFASLTTAPTVGSFDHLTYTLYGYNGAPASFGFTAGGMPTTTATGTVALATGALINGNVYTIPTLAPGGAQAFVPGATLNANFTPSSGESPFFVAPVPFYNIAVSSFNNTTTEVLAIPGGFEIIKGGGTVNFAATAVPEPVSLSLLGIGLVGMGLLRKRRATA